MLKRHLDWSFKGRYPPGSCGLAEGSCIISSTISQLIFCIIERGFLGQCVSVCVVYVCGCSNVGGGLSFYPHGCVHVCMCPIRMCMYVFPPRLGVYVCMCVSGALTLYPTGNRFH